MIFRQPYEGFALSQYLTKRIDELEIKISDRSENLKRLIIQSKELNTKVTMLYGELEELEKLSPVVGEIVKLIDKRKALVDIPNEGKCVVDIEDHVKMTDIIPKNRAALTSKSFSVQKILPEKIDPLISLMKLNHIPESTYEMIGGLGKQIREIKEVIELPIKHPELFEALGIEPPKGVLLYGAPGTGKTLLARAVSHHTNCTFIRVSGTEFVRKFIGEGANLMQQLFLMARKHAPSIIFIDEIDSIGLSRLQSRGDKEVQRTMLELLNQLDGFEPTKNIKVIMATNRIDILDESLLRSGRIDKKIEFPTPNEEARLDIFKIHSRKMNLKRGINLRKLAEMTPQSSGAEIKAICTEAGIYAIREKRNYITQEDFEMAVGYVMRREKDNITTRQWI